MEKNFDFHQKCIGLSKHASCPQKLFSGAAFNFSDVGRILEKALILNCSTY